ncbi:hypothetical protein D3C85_1513060 [compost metagenome]
MTRPQNAAPRPMKLMPEAVTRKVSTLASRCFSSTTAPTRPVVMAPTKARPAKVAISSLGSDENSIASAPPKVPIST